MATFTRSTSIGTLIDVENLKSRVATLNSGLNSSLLTNAANENNNLLKKYKTLKKGFDTISGIGGINRPLAMSLDRTLNGALSNRLNLSGFTEEMSKVGYGVTRTVLMQKMSLVITESNYRDNLKYIQDCITTERLAEVIGILDVIGLREDVDTDAHPLTESQNDVITKIFVDLHIPHTFTDQDALTALGSVEVKGALRVKVTQLLSNVEMGLNASTEGAITPAVTNIKRGDVLAVRAFARICGNLDMLVEHI